MLNTDHKEKLVLETLKPFGYSIPNIIVKVFNLWNRYGNYRMSGVVPFKHFDDSLVAWIRGINYYIFFTTVASANYNICDFSSPHL